MKKWFFIFYILSFSAFAENCNESVKNIYQNIINSIGNNSLYPPELHFSNNERSVAYMSNKGITIEQKVIDLFWAYTNIWGGPLDSQANKLQLIAEKTCQNDLRLMAPDPACRWELGLASTFGIPVFMPGGWPSLHAGPSNMYKYLLLEALHAADWMQMKFSDMSAYVRSNVGTVRLGTIWVQVRSGQ